MFSVDIDGGIPNENWKLKETAHTCIEHTHFLAAHCRKRQIQVFPIFVCFILMKKTYELMIFRTLGCVHAAKEDEQPTECISVTDHSICSDAVI